MRMRKHYGHSREDTCPFCGKRATVQNAEGLLVCPQHRDESLPAIRCTCGELLDQKEGKFGPYFHCFNCGNVSFRKGLELMELAVPRKRQRPGTWADGEYVPHIDEL